MDMTPKPSRGSKRARGSASTNRGGVTPAVRLPEKANEQALRGQNSRTADRPAIDLHIHELVLHGFSPFERHSIADAIVSELHRLFVHEGMPPQLSEAVQIAHIDAGSLHVEEQKDLTGTNLARAIYGGLRG